MYEPFKESDGRCDFETIVSSILFKHKHKKADDK